MPRSLTLFTTLLAAFQILLLRYTGQADFCIGSPVANRGRSDMGKYIGWMIGLYVLAKVLEQLDSEIYAAGNLLSGHSLKHVAAALAAAALLAGLYRRRHA